MIADAVSAIRSRLRDVNLVSFSGGKDSSTVLQLVLEAFQGNPGKLFIVTADTLMEIPYFQDYVERTKDRLREYIRSSKINAEVITVRPEYKHSFWVSVLGLGYPAAHMGFRWCTGKLKIEPITKFTRTVTADKSWSVFVGVRSAESEMRARIYQVKDYKPNHYAPILDWSSHDVWEFLLSQQAPWGDHSELVNVYRYSSDECVYGEKQGVCVGNARYGCWACPLQKETQLEMIGFHTGDQKRYAALRHFKKMFCGAANRTGCRSHIRRNGTFGAGPFLVETRKMLYGKLKQTESTTGWRLIHPEEEKIIFEHWETDADVHNVPDQTQPLLWGAI